MIDYKEQIGALLAGKVSQIDAEELADMLEVPADETMGDYALPCFRLAKALKQAPPQIAADLAEKIKGEDLFEKVEPVGPYLNMSLDRQSLAREVVAGVLQDPAAYGSGTIGQGKKVIVEYSSPNIAKPFHIGHIRSTVIGAAIANIYDAMGYEVIRINHLGDYGTQFGKMICAYRHWGNKEDVEREPIRTLLSYYTKFHEEAEKDPSLEDEAREIFARLEQGEAEEVKLWQWFRDESLKEFNRVYDMLGIGFDSYAGESFYSDKMDRFVTELSDTGLLKESEGARIVELEEYGMSPAMITKSDGSTLYITRDIAAAVYRKEHYDFYRNIYVVANAQELHFKQWIKILELMGYDWAKDCVHVPFGLVSLEDGAMSTRHGRVVFLEDVLNRAVDQTKKIMEDKGVDVEDLEKVAAQVGIGAVIFQELSNNRIKDYTFDWDRVLNFDGETGPYVQYTHARACSVLRKAKAVSDEDLERKLSKMPQATGHITSNSAYDLAKLIYAYPRIVTEAGEKYEPSVVTRHIIDIAQSFNRFYHDEHIIVDDEEERIAKLALVAAARTTIANGLHLLGIQAPERM